MTTQCGFNFLCPIFFFFFFFYFFLSLSKVPESILDGVINDIMPHVARPVKQNKRGKSQPVLNARRNLV